MSVAKRAKPDKETGRRITIPLLAFRAANPLFFCSLKYVQALAFFSSGVLSKSLIVPLGTAPTTIDAYDRKEKFVITNFCGRKGAHKKG